MAEYITKEQIINILYAPRKAILTFDDFVASIGNLTPTDVVGRKEYEAVCIKCNNLENRIEKQNKNIKRLKAYESIVETENKELRSKINKAIEEIQQTLYVDSLIFGELCDFKDEKISADDVIEKFNRVTRKEVLEILKRNIGE